jgi:hypothetical protein
MRLSEMETEVHYQLDREDASITDRVRFWIQNSIDLVYAALPKEERQRTAALTTVDGQQYLDVPGDYGEFLRIVDSDEQKLEYKTPLEFFNRHTGFTDSGAPKIFTFWNNQFLFSPIPNAGLSLDLHYFIERPNIYNHNLQMTRDASASSNGTQIYIDEDGIADGEGKLLSVTANNADTVGLLEAADGHKHELPIYDDDNAATNGVPWYFDESEAINYFISPTKTYETVVKTNAYRRHSHILNFVHNPDPTAYPNAENKIVYVDEDNVDMGARIIFAAHGGVTVNQSTILAEQGVFPGFLERYHSIVFELAVAKGLRFDKKYEQAKLHAEIAQGMMSLIAGKDIGKLDEQKK